MHEHSAGGLRTEGCGPEVVEHLYVAADVAWIFEEERTGHVLEVDHVGINGIRKARASGTYGEQEPGRLA